MSKLLAAFCAVVAFCGLIIATPAQASTVEPEDMVLMWHGAMPRGVTANPPCHAGSYSEFDFIIKPHGNRVFQPHSRLVVEWANGQLKRAAPWYKIHSTTAPQGFVWGASVYGAYYRQLRLNPSEGTRAGFLTFQRTAATTMRPSMFLLNGGCLGQGT